MSFKVVCCFFKPQQIESCIFCSHTSSHLKASKLQGFRHSWIQPGPSLAARTDNPPAGGLS